MAKQILLIGDIGGTNARFALADDKQPGFTNQITLQCANFKSADEAIDHYLHSVGAVTPDEICLAVAGPVSKQRVRFTNNPWVIDSKELARKYSVERVQLLNDFEAIAYAVPFLGAEDLMSIGTKTAQPLQGDDYTIAVVGPGTGLGVVGLKKFRRHLIPIVGEASHGGFAPESARQIEVLIILREKYERVSSERLVSGAGIENIYLALCSIDKKDLQPKSAADIFTDCDQDSTAAEAVSLFFEILGQVSGNMALAFGAADGVFIAGGIATRYAERLANSRFREAFESKGRHRSILEDISTQLILHPQPGLLGAAYSVRQIGILKNN